MATHTSSSGPKAPSGGRGHRPFRTGVPRRVERPTLALIGVCYALWLCALFVAPHIHVWLAVVLVGVAVTLHSSLQHEVIHGHPTPWPMLNEALVFPALSLVIPFYRFRDTHLAHHHDPVLTDPYDDPESNYMDPAVWARLSTGMRIVLRLNNTLLGRIILGPVIGQMGFMVADWRLVRAGVPGVARAWIWHIPAAVLVLVVAWCAPAPLWVSCAGAYLGLALLKVRTFLEHQAHETVQGRTVVIEDRGPLAFLFLNNNFHIVHHLHPGVPWYRLPDLYFSNAQRYLRGNGGYRYASYADVFRRHLFQAKDPVPHPHRRADGGAQDR